METQKPLIEYNIDVIFHDKQMTTSITGGFMHIAHALKTIIKLINHSRKKTDATLENISIHIKRAKA